MRMYAALLVLVGIVSGGFFLADYLLPDDAPIVVFIWIALMMTGVCYFVWIMLVEAWGKFRQCCSALEDQRQ